ncbi:MAG: hypothetical protein H7268_10520 [Sandarakinorhabdus sp.]|nr:hypothetical protein [Sandarakinorhabdus sp.]
MADPPAPPTAQPVLRLDAVTRSNNIGLPSQTGVLHAVDMQLLRGEFLALMAPSGSGKSTLLNLVGLLDRPPRAAF